MSYVIVATYQVKPGQEGELAGHLEAMLAPTRAEEGCQSYDVYRSNEDEQTFVLVEVYRDQEAFDSHFKSAHFDEHIANGAWPLLESRSVVRGQPLTDTA